MSRDCDKTYISPIEDKITSLPAQGKKFARVPIILNAAVNNDVL